MENKIVKERATLFLSKSTAMFYLIKPNFHVFQAQIIESKHSNVYEGKWQNFLCNGVFEFKKRDHR